MNKHDGGVFSRGSSERPSPVRFGVGMSQFDPRIDPVSVQGRRISRLTSEFLASLSDGDDEDEVYHSDTTDAASCKYRVLHPIGKPPAIDQSSTANQSVA
jgi:hypothetical protein